MAALKETTKGKNYVLYTDGTNELVLLKNVRFSFPHYGRKHENKDKDTGKVRNAWNGVAMLPKSTHEAAHDVLVGIMKKMLEVNEAKVARENRFLRDGDNEEADIPSEYKDHWYVTFSESADPGKSGRAPARPPVRDQFGKLMIDPERGHDAEYMQAALDLIDEKAYGGCWGNVLVRPWYFNGKAANGETYPKRLLCGYAGVQLIKTPAGCDDKPFGNGRIDSSGAAWDTSDEDDEDDGLGKSKKKVSDEDDDEI